MPYDEGLAARVRDTLANQPTLAQRKMFGGIASMVRGHMTFGIVKDELMARVGPEQHDRALEDPHVRAMDFTGRPMTGLVFVRPEGLAGEAALDEWVRRWLDFDATLPAK
jgi:hypothetical protein